MGCVTQKQSRVLSPKLRDKVLRIFRKIDVDGSKSIDKEETAKYWKSNFAKLNTNALFKTVDFDGSGSITEDEWLAFWQIVKRSGHSEKEINDELDNLLEGKAWVKFRNVDEYIMRDQKEKQGQNIHKIVDDERKKLDHSIECLLLFFQQFFYFQLERERQLELQTLKQ
ncbi:hypothetical protein IMG5_063650 [Ichthyophthirius multifiliis]|uniref:EF-hand domain-containing protein n=1 Tax=Ichthyophthirius multifiliis TaxID=5932 RepID=G0QP37_ICHMU|nr:hypothetical protein IMG5_063650 [Ichthyophthirius multifiliis]EGR33024.1 hypothetical protein IMG5_063650 [Ichthyophthirius multifiliis]|eukprot:XP_004037010.1 hypothetical protein IMG5_063650 [Ichthyophthirius multifiliis]